MVLPWLPIMAVLFFFTVERGGVIVCEPERCELEAQKGFSTRRYPIKSVRIEKDEDTKREALVVDANGLARFDLRERLAPTFAAYEQSRATKSAARIPVGGRAWFGMLGFIVGFELLLIGYYAVAQRAITLEVDSKTGRVRVLERKRARTREVTTFDLEDVEELDLIDFDHDATGQAVEAVMKNGKRRRLFDAVNAEASRGLDFLEAARARATSPPQ